MHLSGTSQQYMADKLLMLMILQAQLYMLKAFPWHVYITGIANAAQVNPAKIPSANLQLCKLQ